MNAKLTALRGHAVLLALVLAGQAVLAQETPSLTGEYKPTVGQPGKDVIWVPTPDALVEKMLEMAHVGPTDYVIDLGSGDGRTVIAAAQKFGARAMGIEYNPDMVALSKRNAEAAGVSHMVEFVKADIFESDFRQATVITMYLLPRLNIKLRPTILGLRPGTRVVSHAFDMDDWQPDEKVTIEGRNAFLWIVPAEVWGDWKLTVSTEQGEETWSISLLQEFQMVTGRVELPDGSVDLVDGKMEGPELRFDLIDSSGARREVTGRAFTDRLSGTMVDEYGNSSVWSAVRNDNPQTPRT